MKLATFKDGTRDGRLLVVSGDLKQAVDASRIAPTLLLAIENWEAAEDRLQRLAAELATGKAHGAFELDCRRLHAPLPRTWQWLDASTFHSHSDLLERVLGQTPPPEKRIVPLMYQGGSDDFLGPTDDMPLPSADDDIDFEGEVAIIVDRVPMGTTVEEAGVHIKLLMLVNDASLRGLARRELATGYGFLQCKPASCFSPVAVTPDELGPGGWQDFRVRHPLCVWRNDTSFGNPDAGQMGFSFAQLIAHAARTRNLSAGTIIGSGTVSNDNYRDVGSACIAERRAVEHADFGSSLTPYLGFGERVRMEMFDADGRSIFGAIDHRIVKAG